MESGDRKGERVRKASSKVTAATPREEKEKRQVNGVCKARYSYRFTNAINFPKYSEIKGRILNICQLLL